MYAPGAVGDADAFVVSTLNAGLSAVIPCVIVKVFVCARLIIPSTTPVVGANVRLALLLSMLVTTLVPVAPGMNSSQQLTTTTPRRKW